jgi:RNA polymerase sigma factor (sigma-70 family)
MEAMSQDPACIRLEDLQDLIGEIRLMARAFLSSERACSFTPTALAMTALRRAKLSEQDWTEVRWENRAHFFSTLGLAMKHALVDHARRRRSSGRQNIIYFPPDEDFFRDLPAEAEHRPERYILVEVALSRLEQADARLAACIRQFYYLGHTTSEIAALAGVSEKTIDRDLKKARTLLRKFLDDIPTAA